MISARAPTAWSRRQGDTAGAILKFGSSTRAGSLAVDGAAFEDGKIGEELTFAWAELCNGG